MSIELSWVYVTKWNIHKMYVYKNSEKRLADPFPTIVNIPRGLIKRPLEWTFVLKKAGLGYIVKLKKKWWEHKRRPSLSAVFVRPFYFPTSLWQKTMLFAISYTTYYSQIHFIQDGAKATCLFSVKVTPSSYIYLLPAYLILFRAKSHMTIHSLEPNSNTKPRQITKLLPSNSHDSWYAEILYIIIIQLVCFIIYSLIGKITNRICTISSRLARA